MNNHRYILEPYNGMRSRYHCPACNSREKTFVRYFDTEAGNYVNDIVGRCNRENNCGYHYTPKQYFTDNGISANRFPPGNKISTGSTGCQKLHGFHGFHGFHQMEKEPSFIDTDIFKQSISNYNKNIFVKYLIRLFGTKTANELISRYKIGTSKHWSGSTVFWQIDKNGNIRAGKIMLYNENGHRVKEPFNHITWVHKVLKIEPYNLKQSLFGEHLLKGNTLPIAIVESEKTACIASIYLPQFLWLACGQLQGLSTEKCKVLSGQTVILYPDLKGFDKWQAKAKELQSQLPGTRFLISDYLEKSAPETDKREGYDLADYLTRFDIKDFVTDVPRWYVDMQGILRQYENGQITPDQFLDLQDQNCKQSGLSEPEYVKQVNHFETLN